MSRLEPRTWVPVGVLLGGLCMAGGLYATGPRVEPRTVEVPRPFVRTLVAKPERIELRVRTNGSVEPRTESQLVPEISGSVVRVADSLVSGGFFREGEVLLEIDPTDAKVELERARASLARARAEVERTQKELERRKGLAARDFASAQELDRAVSEERVAVANAREAAAVVAQAEKNLERTQVRAPYDGRVREERVDRGGFVTRGTPVATLYSIDYAEVRLPIPDRELAYLDLPLLYRGDDAPTHEADAPGAEAARAPEVRLTARFAGSEYTWIGELVRTEGELDPKTRMVNGIARIPDPYARSADRPPLAVGLFVDAEIVGRTLASGFVLPRTALHDADHVWVVDADDRLRTRRVDVLRVEGESVILTGGLVAGERVNVSSLDVAVDGMQVRTGDLPGRAPDTSPRPTPAAEVGS